LQTEELEVLLDGAEETPSLEFKGPMNWSAPSIAKDILAMANIQDGGRIIFGVEDGTFKRIGLSQEQINTFIIDTMKDQIAEYADPYVSFGVTIASDRNGLRYAVLTVSPFDEFPVICKRENADVQRGTIYCRPPNQKAQSARVSNSNDMREIVELAVVRRMRRLQRLGFAVPESDMAALDEELGGL
jgi:predicted HTH transcriptional regulator